MAKDSDNILLNGTGTPYVAIFDSKKNPIIDPVSNLPIGVLVSSFTYVYDEEREDNGNIHIICNNPNLVALPALGYQMSLHLQWGWLLSESSIFCGPVRKVIIIGVKVEFTNNGVEIDLDIADSSILLKNTPSNYYKNNTKGRLFSEYLRGLLSGVPCFVSLKDYSSSLVTEVKKFFAVVDKNTLSDYEDLKKETQVGNRYVLGNITMGSNNIPTAQFLTQDTQVNYEDLVGIVIVEYDPSSGESYEKWVDKVDDLVKKYPDRYGYINIQQPYNFANVVKGTSRNAWSQFINLANNIPNGPYYMDGRDGKLEIHNRKYNRPVSKTYTYYGGNGELLHFSAESKFTKKTISVSKGSEISPEDKSIKTKSEQLVNGSILYVQNKVTVSGEVYYPSAMFGGGASFEVPITRELIPTGYPVSTKNLTQEDVEQYIVYYKDHPKYNSVSDGIDSSRYDLTFTKEELKQYENLVMTNFDSAVERAKGFNPNTSEKSISDNLHGQVDILPPFEVKRQFLVKSYKNRPTTDSAGKAIDPVKEYFGGFNFGKDENGEPYDLQLLQRDIPQEGGTYYDLYQITFKVDGLKLIDQGAFGSGVDVGNDLEHSITNQITASATVLGDPTIESSMNFLIQNVSDLYSGTWYAKKITHSINSGDGYTCDIEFVQQSKVSERITIASEVSTAAMTKSILADKEVYKKNFTDDKVCDQSLYNKMVVRMEEARNQSETPFVTVYGEIKDGQVYIHVIPDDGTPEYNYPVCLADSDWGMGSSFIGIPVSKKSL